MVTFQQKSDRSFAPAESMVTPGWHDSVLQENKVEEAIELIADFAKMTCALKAKALKEVEGRKPRDLEIGLHCIANLLGLPLYLTWMVERNQNSWFGIKDWSRWTRQEKLKRCGGYNPAGTRFARRLRAWMKPWPCASPPVTRGRYWIA